jgi:hypothetical protein
MYNSYKLSLNFGDNLLTILNLSKKLLNVHDIFLNFKVHFKSNFLRCTPIRYRELNKCNVHEIYNNIVNFDLEFDSFRVSCLMWFMNHYKWSAKLIQGKFFKYFFFHMEILFDQNNGPCKNLERVSSSSGVLKGCHNHYYLQKNFLFGHWNGYKKFQF